MTKEQIKAIIKQYANKGERLFLEASESNESYAESYWDGYKDCADGLLRELDDVQEEPVNEDLEEEIKRYLHEVLDRDNTVGDVARHFAKWQKEQIMKNAVECVVECDVYGLTVPKEAVKKAVGNTLAWVRDKVKVIIIKED